MMAYSEGENRRVFSDLIGEIGAVWGLPQNACRVHALLYIRAAGTARLEIGSVLGLTDEEVSTALTFLQDYELAWSEKNDVFMAHSDPWDAMMKGLDQRRDRDLPSLRNALEACQKNFRAEAEKDIKQINKIVKLVDDLSSIHAQAFRFSPRLLRSMVGVSGRTARFFGGNNR